MYARAYEKSRRIYVYIYMDFIWISRNDDRNQ